MSQTLNQAKTEGWMDRYLPACGFERWAFLVVVALVLAFKALAIHHFRSDSDETQHAHVVWGWVTGQLQYRDFFDNHMPLFQMLCAPIMRLFGERADIMVLLRWVMLPMYLGCGWCVYRLTELLYSRRAAPWSALCGVTLWKYFYTSTEFRTDDLWALFWFLALVVAISGKFTVKRAWLVGLMLGLAFAVSLKTTALVIALAAATVLAMALAWIHGEWPNLLHTAARLGPLVLGTLIPPVATILYFAWQGAFWIMYYCVVRHNLVPGLKRWGDISIHHWYFPLSVLFMGAYGWLIFRQTPDKRLAMRRVIIVVTPWLYLCLLLSYWPDITREDDLTYIPLAPLSAIPLLMLVDGIVRSEGLRRCFWKYGLPALALLDFVVTTRAHNIQSNRLAITIHNIGDVLAITKPDDYVMDDKGDYVFRRRAYYWVIEPITKARVRKNLIQDSIPQRLTEKEAKLCSMDVGRSGSIAAQFIVANYVLFDPLTREMGALGKIIGHDAQGGTYSFDVVIPQTYAVLTETGQLAGDLDGKPYTGPVWLAAGRHVFHRTAGGGHVAIFLNDAYSKGFSPLYEVTEKYAQQRLILPNRKKKPELQ